MTRKDPSKTGKVWGGRFREGLHGAVDRFNASLAFDRRLYAEDIEGSMAHCRMLSQQGIIGKAEAARMLRALAGLKEEMDRGVLGSGEDFEDIHTLVEKTLVERIGPAGERLHTGRSRNDQVSLDLRLYMKKAIRGVDSLIREAQRALVGLAEEHMGFIMPGYTHLQRAQPVLLSHHLLAYHEMLKRDRARFRENFKRVNILPLGSAALAGSTFPLDRQVVAKELGFEALSENSMDAVSDRDFVAEFLFASSVCMMHLSRLSEEVVLWSTREFGFVTLPDALCTGSSIMPQKKNPDLPELVRGKTGRVYGNLIGLLTTLKGLPLTYNKDLQEDKEALFDTVDTLEQCLTVMTLLLQGLSFNRDVMRRASERGYLVATDLADYLVQRGVTFRKAHETVGEMVLYAMEHRKELHDLTLKEMKRFCGAIRRDVKDWLVPSKCILRRELTGGTGPRAVKRSIEKAKKELGM